eukprot:COSAG02_NODE_1332_length_13211_cov_14.766397_8_plen_193_part_00
MAWLLVALACAAGILDPYGYRTIEGDFICDFLLALFVDPGSIDENMQKDNPYLSSSLSTQLLDKQFANNNMPMPNMAPDALLEAGTKSGKFDEEGVPLVHIDHLLEVVHEQYVRAVESREQELIVVFSAYDKVRTSTATVYLPTFWMLLLLHHVRSFTAVSGYRTVMATLTLPSSRQLSTTSTAERRARPQD